MSELTNMLRAIVALPQGSDEREGLVLQLCASPLAGLLCALVDAAEKTKTRAGAA